MGFKITVEYPVDKIEIKAVSKGELTTKGNFITNMGINDGKFDVLWNNTENVNGDGTLFVITAQAKADINKDCNIKLSYSQPDTFNESYQDVKLNCHNILISANKVETTAPVTEKEDNSTTKAPVPIDSSQVTDAVQTALDDFGYKNLSEVKDEKKFIKRVNKNLETISGTQDHNVSDMDSLNSLYVSAYEGEFVAQTTNNIDSEKINAAVEKALQTVDAKAVDEIEEKDKAKFVAEVEKNLKAENPDTPNISQAIETDRAVDIIKKIYSATKPATKQETTGKQETESNGFSAFYIVIPIAVILALAGLFFVKRRKKSNKAS